MSTVQSQLHGRDLLIDSNLLLLGVVGNFDVRLVGQGRLEAFVAEDLDRLNEFTSLAKQLITTPGILTETSNLAAQMIGKLNRSSLFERFRAIIRIMDQRHERASVVCEQPAFLRLGLTDAEIAQIANKDMIVLTVDFPLHGYLHKNGIRALNFNHYRAEQ